MKMRVFIQFSLFLLLYGCVGTAHRELSRGYLDLKSGWKVSAGGGHSSSFYATVFENKDVRLEIIPCNYEPGYSVLLLPIPMPLGSQPGIEKGPQFLVSGTIYADGHLTYSPRNAFIRINGREIAPMKAANNSKTCDVKETYKYVPELKRSQEVLREWRAVNADLIFSSNRYMYFSLWFDMPTPSVEDKFEFYLGSLSIEGKNTEVPIISFSRGSSWGGW